MRRLNFGCGSIQPAGWTNVDREDFGQEYVGSTDLFADDTFDIIVAHCSLQLTEYNDILALLCELRRVLKVGGVLRVSLPDIVRGFYAYEHGEIEWFPNSETSIESRFSNWITWYSTTRSLWTVEAIIDCLMESNFESAGFRHFGESVVAGGAELDTREGECFFVEALK
jgi:predicted SAM-dependent methyltransferase